MIRQLLLIGLFSVLSGCSTHTMPNQPHNTESFKQLPKSDPVNFLDHQALAEFEAESDVVYHLGEGDKISLQVWNRPELSGKHTVGPDGQITIPLIGSMRITPMTREEAAGKISKKLKPYYTDPLVNLEIEEYQANRITILGRVLTPGTMHFDRQPMLLDALARAGSLPLVDKQTHLTRCAIFRGREKIIWVDLNQLMRYGDLAYNIRLKPDDLVYIPDSQETLVYVMGAVQKPGVYRLDSNMSIMDALTQAGGPNEDANEDEISLYRPSKKSTQRLPLKSLITSDRKVNYALEEGDVVYVPKRGIADVGYVLRQLMPGLSFMTFGYSTGMVK
jgi:polysaccharide export outer membrane protein